MQFTGIMITVLYIDDEPALLEIGKLYLERLGEFQVKTVTSAKGALEAIKRRDFDAIISDYQMPVMNGIDFLKEVRASGNTIPFIIFTGRGREEVVIQALNEGADFYLQKGGEPASQFAELAHKVRQAVQQRRAEISIRDHERREAEILNFLPDATFAIDTGGVVIAWNRAIERMTGVRAENIVGKGNYEYAIPFYHEQRPILIDLVLKDDPATAAKYPFIRREGRTLFSEVTIPHFNKGLGAALWFTASPLYNTRGEVIGAIESIREITDRKKVEEALNESERRFRELAEMLPQVVYEADADGKLTYVNRIAFEMFGYTVEDFKKGLNAMDMIAPDDRNRTALAIRNVLETGSTKHREFRALRKDGSTFPVSIYSSPVVRDGDIVGLRGIIIEITDIKRAEEKIRESEQNYRLLFETATEGILVAQGDRMVHVNPALVRLLGYPEDILTSRPFTDFIHPDDRGMVMNHHLQRMKGEAPSTGYTFRVITVSGEERWVWINSTLMQWSGTPASLSFLTDITGMKKAEQQLISANREYANLLDQIQDVYYRSDVQGRLIMASQSWARLLGYDDLLECIGRNIADDFYVNPADRTALIGEIYQDGKVTNYEIQLKKKNGTPVVIETCSHLYYDERGDILGVEGTFRDITEKKEQESVLKTQLDLGLKLQKVHGLHDTLETCLWAAIEISGMDSGGIYLVCRETGAVDLFTSVNLGDAFKKSVSHYPPDSCSARFVREGIPLFIPYEKMAALYHTPEADEEGILSIAAIPILSEERSIACLNVSSHKNTGIPENRRVALKTVATQIGAAIERILVEETLAESEQRYRNVVEDQTEFISRFLPDGTHVFVNDAYCRYFGFTREEVIGHRFKPVIPGEDRGHVKQFFESLKKEHPVGSIDHRIIMPDGSIRWQRWSDRAIFDAEETLIEYQSVGRDITEQKKTDEELRTRSEELDSRNRIFTTLLETVPIGIFMVEAPGGKPILVNREATRLLGRGMLPDATGDNFAEVYRAFKADGCKKYPANEMPIILGMRGVASHVDDVIVVRPDNTRVNLEVFGTPVIDRDGNVVASLASFIDITERKRVEISMKEINKKIALLSSITRHDVANQVTILRGLAQFAVEKETDSNTKNLLEKIDYAGSMIARQIEFTRTYQEIGMHEPSWFSLAAIIGKMQPPGVPLMHTCSNAEIYADPMVEKVFLNLFDNSVRHGGHVTDISIRCEQDSDHLVIIYEDNGTGIPEEEKEKIFGRGFGEHTGLGLFLSREILWITGISIIETGTYGRGARFEIHVPAGSFRNVSCFLP